MKKSFFASMSPFLLSRYSFDNFFETIAGAASFPVGAILPFKIKCSPNKAVTIQATGGDVIEDGSKIWDPLWACDGDEFKLIAVDTNNDSIADLWVMIDAKGNFDIAGNDALVRVQPRNSFVANGTLSSRADFPRVWAAVSASVIDDFVGSMMRRNPL